MSDADGTADFGGRGQKNTCDHKNLLFDYHINYAQASRLFCLTKNIINLFIFVMFFFISFLNFLGLKSDEIQKSVT